MRFVVRDASTFLEMQSEIETLISDGVEVVVPDFVADEIGPLPEGAVVVETPAGREQRKTMACWELAGRPEDLRPLPITEAGRMLAMARIQRMRDRATRADSDAVDAILARVPDVPPDPGDELP